MSENTYSDAFQYSDPCWHKYFMIVKKTSVKSPLRPSLTCTSANSMTLSWEFRGLGESGAAVTSSGHPVKHPLQHPAALLCLTSGYLPALHSCFSCFQCSAMQKINSSSYSPFTRTGLNTVSTSTYLFPLYQFSLLLHTSSRWHDLCALSPSNVQVYIHISSRPSPVLHSICSMFIICHQNAPTYCTYLLLLLNVSAL